MIDSATNLAKNIPSAVKFVRRLWWQGSDLFSVLRRQRELVTRNGSPDCSRRRRCAFL